MSSVLIVATRLFNIHVGRFFGHDCYYAWALGPVWAPVKSDDYYFLSSLILNMLFHRVDVD